MFPEIPSKVDLNFSYYIKDIKMSLYYFELLRNKLIICKI